MITRGRLPPKLPKTRNGIIREDFRREFRPHRRFVKDHGCCVPGCFATDIEFAHVRDAANAGIGIKPPDWFAVGMCRVHHQEQHDCGVWTFQDRHKIDLYELADDYVRNSPDKNIRLAKRIWQLEREAALPIPALTKPIAARNTIPAVGVGRQDKTDECPGADHAQITPSAGEGARPASLHPPATGILPANDDTPEPIGFTWFPVCAGDAPVKMPVMARIA